jgi:hypothetical protein
VLLGGFSFENALFSRVHGKPKIIQNIEDISKSMRLGGLSLENVLFSHLQGKPKIIHNIRQRR